MAIEYATSNSYEMVRLWRVPSKETHTKWFTCDASQVKKLIYEQAQFWHVKHRNKGNGSLLGPPTQIEFV